MEISDIDCGGPDCPVRKANEVLSGKWTTLVLRDLLGGPRRYSDLERSVLGISPRMLADRLHLLEEQGLVSRKVFPTNPPKTEYALTSIGRQVIPVIAAMAGFGQVLAARTAP